ncbi:protein DWARF 53-like isoform X1 [Typha angustifolia]|uniref:protein DWARF 53-like isoform X1 n=1 Tax=Typha angustifolia TaxID=59011 RepID=UPI003C2BD796
MPTPVATARQCLANDAAAALDEAVAAARRRAHAQTTSLHVVFALLSTSSATTSSLLRDALARARSSAYSSRLQFKALELCFGVALDRLPSAATAAPSPAEEPPVSNSLMAAIKRSQANQRRNPDTFHLYQQQCSAASSSTSSSSFSGVKVELQQLVLAILDDPVVSRVFGEAGFRSCDIKLAILRPTPPILRFPRAARCPPMFLCTYSSGDEFEGRGFAFPFAAPDGSEENCRRIGDVLARRSGGGRNPLLVGIGAGEAANDFAAAVERRNWASLPPELRGLRIVSVGSDSDAVDRIEEMAAKAEEPGLVLSVGDLKGLVEEEDKGGSLVAEITRVLEVHQGMVWVIGWSATYETYLKLLSRYPILDREWDLQLLPITSARAAAMGGGSFSKPQSLMDSFVPFGGFFPATYESKGLLNTPHPSVHRCQHCNDKYEQEVTAIRKAHSATIEAEDQTNLPSWMRKANTVSMKGLEAAKAKDDKSVLNSKIMDLQKKWNDYCQRLHRGCQRLETDNYQLFPQFVGLPCASDRERTIVQNSNADVNQKQRDIANSLPMTMGLQNTTTATQSISLPLVSQSNNKDLMSNLQLRISKSEQLEGRGLQSLQGSRRDFHNIEDHASPSSVTSVTTDLVLGTPREPPSKEESPRQTYKEHPEKSGNMQAKKDAELNRNIPQLLVQSYPCSKSSSVKGVYPVSQIIPAKSSAGLSAYDQRCLASSRMLQKLDPSNYKSLCASLLEKVGRQEEALSAISHAIVHCTAGERRRGASLKGDIWLSFHGPDRVAKRRVAVALAELVCGNKENLICIDLSYQDGACHLSTIYGQQDINPHKVDFRGKTNADYIAGEVNKKPWSVIFLENVDEADFLIQNSLSHAIQTGRFPDSHGREVSINNAIFVMATRTTRGNTFTPRIDSSNFSEERILTARGWQMKILTESIPLTISSSPNNKVSVSPRQKSRSEQPSLCSVFVSKRKMNSSGSHDKQFEYLGTSKRPHRSSNTFLDLNLPVEEIESNDADSSSSHEYNSLSDNPEAWADNFYNLVDKSVNFGPFDFDALADSILKDISKIFCDTFGSNFVLEIDVKAMEQILAAAWVSEDGGSLSKWLEQVLGRSFIELKRRYNLLSPAILRLVACEDALMEEHPPGILLPSRIILD